MPQPPSSIYEAVFGDSDSQNDKTVAVIDVGRRSESVGYAQLKRIVDVVRTTTAIKAGENVALVMPNSLELIVGLLATWAQGAATAPLNPTYTGVELKDLFDDLNIKTVLVLPGDDKIKAVLNEVAEDINIVEIDVKHLTSSDAPTPPPDQQNGVALYLHTSGTTGKPKAVPLRHSNLIRGAKNVAGTYDLTPKDRTYLLQVLFHIHGIVAALLAPLTTGGSIVIPAEGKLNASCAWADFNKHACTWVTGTPSILQTLLAAPADPLPEIRFMRSCSSPLLPTVFKALRERFQCPVIEAYAMTEASHQMCSNRLDSFASGTVGPESGMTKICIWDSGNQACQLGQEGEVSVCGENVMDGYEGVSPEKNKEAFWHGTDERGHEARWFKTGDRGFLSNDGQRRLTLIGRLSEMVNRGGEKISPVEVDETMMLVDDVKEAATFSVPDEFYGQEIEAALVLKDGSKLDEASLQGLLESRLAKFKIPKRIHFCEGAIPKGPTGKIQRKNLSQKFAGDSPEAPVSEQSTEIDVHSLIDRSLNLKPGQAERQPKATLLELGADSLGLAKIVSSFKRMHGRQLDMATMFSFPSVETAVRMASQGTRSNQNQDEDTHKPSAFSLLPNGKEDLQHICDQAGVQSSDIEDAFPLSASQKMYFDIFLGDHKDTDMMWQMNRYRMTKGTDQKRLVQALDKLQKHEESLRWVLAEDPKFGWVTLQLSPDADSCVEQLECPTDDEAKKVVESRLASCKHHAGTRTAIIFVIKIAEELEMTFIESHGFTEGQGRSQMFETLTQAYKEEAMDPYPPYTNFIQRYPAGTDSQYKLSFWEKEDAAMKHSDGADWDLKQKVLENPPDLTKDRLDLLGVERSVHAPFNKLTVQTGMTIPFIAEAIYALSLALYFGQQDPAFLRGSVVYDRCISLRTADPQFSGVRPVTGGYHPNSVLLAVAQSSLWAHFQNFKSITQLREQNVCVNNTVEIANHSAAFTWRFHDDDEPEQQIETGVDPSQLIAGVKGEKVAFRAFKMCYVNANRKGDEGVTIAIGFHQKWLEDQRRQGSSIELIDVYCNALKFCADNNANLHKLSLEDLRKAVMK